MITVEGKARDKTEPTLGQPHRSSSNSTEADRFFKVHDADDIEAQAIRRSPEDRMGSDSTSSTTVSGAGGSSDFKPAGSRIRRYYVGRRMETFPIRSGK